MIISVLFLFRLKKQLTEVMRQRKIKEATRTNRVRAKDVGFTLIGDKEAKQSLLALTVWLQEHMIHASGSTKSL